MGNLNTVDEILDFAIGNEEEAAQFYTDMAERVEKPWMRKIFEEFSREEQGHKAKLLAIKKGKTFAPASGEVPDLKITDYLIDVEPKPDMKYQDALIVAMKAEKAAFRLYTDLAASTDDKTLQQTFQALSQEEAKHKLRFEVEYDDAILK